jgi:ribonucleotide reductase alpha subunit
MKVVKRNGETEDVSFDKVLKRLQQKSHGLTVDVFDIAQKVVSRIYDGVNTSELDELAAQLCSSMMIENPDYGKLAAAIIISNHHKNTSPSFSETIQIMYDNKDIEGNSSPLINDKLYEVVMKNKEKLNSYIDHDRDYSFDYFGFKTLERAYLTKVNGKIVERPQYMWMRVALGIHDDDFKDALQTYDLMSKKFFTHATPTLFNAGTRHQQMSSCYLLAMENDSLDGIYNTVKDCALISKFAGGIGLHVHNIRAKGSYIRGTNGRSTGLVPMLRVLNMTARYVYQGSRRLGSVAMYLEPWHADIEAFIQLRKNHGSEEERCRDLFLALWVCDLFMERVKDNGLWSLMCPDVCKGLSDSYGEDFKKLYEDYESKGMFVKQVNAQDLWFKILECQIEGGTPYILYKDAANKKSNQKNLGVIKSSNLCCEIMEYSNHEETAVCNLASICLPSYIRQDEDKLTYDYDLLHDTVKVITKNLNKIIDKNFYPTSKTRRSNLKHRPVGIGTQGLADVFAILRIPFESEEAQVLNRNIFETIYHAAVETSMEISKKRSNIIHKLKTEGKDIVNSLENAEYLKLNEFEIQNLDATHPGAYVSFMGSPASSGHLQFDLWDVVPSDRYDWEKLKYDVVLNGLRNSLLVAPMPTASTSQIMGFNESFEPFTNNLFKRKTLSGEFVVMNKYLISDLVSRGLWNNKMKDTILLNEGSVQNIDEIPDDMKAIYKTVWEIKQKALIDLSIQRGPFVCQSQSLNIFMEEPDFKKLSSMHFYGWGKGLKTGSYYLRTRPRVKTQQFTIDPTLAKQKQKGSSSNTPTGSPEKSNTSYDDEDDEPCLTCSA